MVKMDKRDKMDNNDKPSLNWINVDIKAFMERFGDDPNLTMLAAVATLVVIILTILLVKLLTRGSSSSSSLLLVGLSDSGKTLLFSQLLCNTFVNTVTSMQQNEGRLQINPQKSIQIVDLPGYDRLRIKFWDDFKNKARAIVFVVDSFQFMTNLRDVAEFLYIILGDQVVAKKRVPVLVACNKQDEAKAKSAKILHKQLEKEIGLIRETRLAALESTDGVAEDEDVAIIGNPDKDFSFSDLRMDVEFVDCSCLGRDETQENQLELVRQWIEKVA